MQRDPQDEIVAKLSSRARTLRGLAASFDEKAACYERARSAVDEAAAILEDAALDCKMPLEAR